MMCANFTAHITSSTNEPWIQQQASSLISFSRKKSLSAVSLCLAPSWEPLFLPSPGWVPWLWGCLFPSPVGQRALPGSWWADAFQRVKKKRSPLRRAREISPREDSSSRRDARGDHISGPDELILVLVQEHLEEQLWVTRTCLSLSKRKVVKRQGTQLDQIEMCSHHPHLGWRIVEEKHSLFLNQTA